MKKKHLALILAAAMTVTSVDATALVSAADFSAEETAVQAEERLLQQKKLKRLQKMHLKKRFRQKRKMGKILPQRQKSLKMQKK